MASLTVSMGLYRSCPSLESMDSHRNFKNIGTGTGRSSGFGQHGQMMKVVRAVSEGETINPTIRKTEDKVVDSVIVTDLAKPLTAYCRCWRSGTFPLCDGSHVKHNKATGDNVGPLLLKKQ